MGDFNAKMEAGQVADVVEKYGLGNRNVQCDRLIEFCQEHSFIVTNTWFKNHPRRLYTWISPQDTENHIVRYQIDFIPVSQRFRNCDKNSNTYTGADIGAVMATM